MARDTRREIPYAPQYDARVFGFSAGASAATNDAAWALLQTTVATTGATVTFGPGTFQFSTPIEITTMTGLTLEGAGHRYNVNYRESSTNLRYTGTGSTPAIKVDTNFARNFRMRDLALTYSSGSFTGALLDLGNTVIAGCTFDRVYFGSDGLAGGTALFSAEACVKSNCAEFFTFNQCYFSEAQFGYLGGSVQQNGMTWIDCVFGDLTVAQVRSTAFTGFSWRFIGCNFDPINIPPEYGLDLACNGFELIGCHAVGVSSTVAPTAAFYRLSGRGEVRSGFISTIGLGIRFVTGGVYTLGGGIRIQAASPVLVEGGLFVEHGVDYFLLGTSAGVHTVTRTAAGSGYTSAPTVGFSGGGGSGAAATTSLVGDGIGNITMTNRGSGYTSAPTVSFSGGGGAGASATATIGDAAVDIVPETAAVQTTTLRLGPSRFALAGGAINGYSYRTGHKSAFVTGYIDYSAAQDGSGNGMSLLVGSHQYIQVRRLGQSNVETIVFELTWPMGTSAVEIGTVPAGSIIDEIWVNVEQAFNSGTSDVLDIGITGVSATHFYNDLDVHVVGLTKIASANIPIFKAADSIIVVQRTAVGAAATLGRAQIIVRFQAIT